MSNPKIVIKCDRGALKITGIEQLRKCSKKIFKLLILINLLNKKIMNTYINNINNSFYKLFEKKILENNIIYLSI